MKYKVYVTASPHVIFTISHFTDMNTGAQEGADPSEFQLCVSRHTSFSLGSSAGGILKVDLIFVPHAIPILSLLA